MSTSTTTRWFLEFCAELFSRFRNAKTSPATPSGSITPSHVEATCETKEGEGGNHTGGGGHANLPLVSVLAARPPRCLVSLFFLLSFCLHNLNYTPALQFLSKSYPKPVCLVLEFFSVVFVPGASFSRGKRSELGQDRTTSRRRSKGTKYRKRRRGIDYAT